MRNVVSFAVGMKARFAHQILAWTILGFTVIHVIGIIFESVIHKENLVWSMLSGRKERVAGVASVHGATVLALAPALPCHGSRLLRQITCESGRLIPGEGDEMGYLPAQFRLCFVTATEPK